MLTSDAAERRISATTPAPTIDGCRRDQVRSRSAGRRPAGQDRPAVEEPLQVVGQLLRRPVAVGRLLAERLQDDRLQLGRDGRVERSRAAAGSSSAICRISALRSRPSKGGRRVSSS